MPRRGPITAKELLEQLSRDPEWVAGMAAKERERREIEAEVARAEAPVLRDLRTVGVDIESVWDLVNTADPYPLAIPVLLDHLQRDYPPVVTEGIARALAVREARPAWNAIARRFRRETEERVKDGLAVALAAIAGDDQLDELKGWILDARHGSSRVLLLSALGGRRLRSSGDFFKKLLGDPQVAKQAQAMLDRLKRLKRSKR